MQLQLLVIAAWAAIASGGLPSVRDSLTHPVHVYEGDDALVTCVVRDAGDNTVLWKKEDRERHSLRVLTAGEARVTADRRFDVLHDAVPPEEKINSGGDVWVLVIKETKAADAGIYVCEVNSNPVVRSFHKLSVLSRALQPPPENGTVGAGLLGAGASDAARSAAQRHNYTACCASRNVSAACFGFCAVQSILQGNTGQDPERCEKDFPDIVRCMADGRNHVPCCARQRVPDICQDVCRGEYTVITDNIKTHFSCAAYTEPTLACIAEGVELLPSPPEDVEAAPLTEHSLNVSWAPPRSGGDTVNSFVVTVRLLRSFDEDGEDGFDAVPGDEEDSYAAAAAEAAESRAGAHRPTAPPTPEAPAGPAPPPGVVGTVSLTIPGTYGSTIVNDLQPFAMYEIAVVARNLHGESLPSEAVRALTLAPADAGAEPGDAAPGGAATPPLPDVRGCCTAKGVREASCVTKLCDPAAAAFVAAPDLMVCAPWAADAFSCLANGLDHSPCCRSRGLPDSCLVLCTGNVTQIDFSYFNCLKHLPAYASCLLRGYGVLPSSPRRVHVSHVDSSFALVHWAPPAALADTVLDYALHWRPLSTYDNDYRVVHARRQPFVLEGLRAGADYEVYVEAVNGHGAGDPSPRVVFRTHSQVQVEQEEASLFHNATACCVAAGLSGVCMPLCSYDARMGDVKALAGVCAGELHKLLRCGAGGRDHAPCCARRGVPAACAPVCAGVLAGSLAAAIAGCAPYIGNIVQCFEEGAGLLPGPVEELHATSVRDGAVTLAWQPPTDGSNVTFFVVHYQKADNTTAHETLPRLQNQVNVTDPTADIEGLESGALYSFFVVSQNAHGASLPSSVLLLNATHTETDSPGIAAVPSPPHSLAVSSHSATWLTVSWQPPEFSLPSERLSYKLYHKSASDGDFQLVETSVTSHMLETLLPNTQYIVYVVAVSQKGASLPSETLIAWTDPAYPAFVEFTIVYITSVTLYSCAWHVATAADGAPHQPGDGGRVDDGAVHRHGHAHAHHLALHHRAAGAPGGDAPHGDGGAQRHPRHGPDRVLRRQRLRHAHASLTEDHRQPPAPHHRVGDHHGGAGRLGGSGVPSRGPTRAQDGLLEGPQRPHPRHTRRPLRHRRLLGQGGGVCVRDAADHPQSGGGRRLRLLLPRGERLRGRHAARVAARALAGGGDQRDGVLRGAERVVVVHGRVLLLPGRGGGGGARRVRGRPGQAAQVRGRRLRPPRLLRQARRAPALPGLVPRRARARARRQGLRAAAHQAHRRVLSRGAREAAGPAAQRACGGDRRALCPRALGPARQEPRRRRDVQGVLADERRAHLAQERHARAVAAPLGAEGGRGVRVRRQGRQPPRHQRALRARALRHRRPRRQVHHLRRLRRLGELARGRGGGRGTGAGVAGGAGRGRRVVGAAPPPAGLQVAGRRGVREPQLPARDEHGPHPDPVWPGGRRGGGGDVDDHHVPLCVGGVRVGGAAASHAQRQRGGQPGARRGRRRRWRRVAHGDAARAGARGRWRHRGDGRRPGGAAPEPRRRGLQAPQVAPSAAHARRSHRALSGHAPFRRGGRAGLRLGGVGWKMVARTRGTSGGCGLLRVSRNDVELTQG